MHARLLSLEGFSGAGPIYWKKHFICRIGAFDHRTSVLFAKYSWLFIRRSSRDSREVLSVGSVLCRSAVNSS